MSEQTPETGTTPMPPSATITCYCGAVSTPLAPLVKYTSLPMPAEFCHCNTCRYSAGAITGALFEMKSAPEDSVLSQCVKYESSSKVSRYFCRKCGSHTFVRGWSAEAPVMWFGWSGLVKRGGDGELDGDMTRVAIQAFVLDLVDGGLAGRMARVTKDNKQFEGRNLFQTVYVDMFGEKTVSVSEICDLVDKHDAAVATDNSAPSDSDRLLARCHCGKVEFHITRPDQNKDYPENVQRWLRSSNTKYSGVLCACRSCRSATGTPVQAWTFVPPENIVTTSGKAINFGSVDGHSQLPGLVKHQRGSVVRSFCGGCGATVFFENSERSWVVDISVGILRSTRGSLAEDWLEWSWGRVGHEEEGIDKELMEAISGEEVKLKSG